MQNKHSWGEAGSTVPYGFDPSGEKMALSDIVVQLVGRPNDSPPVTDIAPSGLNGRLSRIASRISGLMAMFPTSLGAKLGAASLSVVPASDAQFVSVGAAAHGVAVAGAPIRIAAKAANANPGAVASGFTTDLIATLVGVQIIKPYSIPEQEWVYAAPAGGILNKNTADIAKTAGAAGVRNYVTGLTLSAEVLGVATEFVLRDGPAGAILFRYKIGTAGLLGGLSIKFPTPLRGTAATTLEMATLTATGTGAVYANVQGYQAP